MLVRGVSQMQKNEASETQLIRELAESRRRVAQMEAKLAETRSSRQRLNLALKSAHIGTWDWNILEDSVTWDDYVHHLFGLKPGVFSGGLEGFIDMLHPDDRQRVRSEAHAP